MPSDWQIEYRGTLADTAPLGDRRTLAAWGLSGIAELSLLNLARGNLVLTVDGTTSFLTDLPWSYRDKIVVWRDGARYWHGWLTAVPRAANDQADQITMVFGDPWWWFETTTMSDPVITNAVTGSVTLESPNGSVTLTAVTSVDWVEPSGTITFAWRDQSAWTVQGQIRRAIYAAIRGGAPLALGTIGIDAPASGQETRGTTALSYIQAACQFEPLSVGWWDYAGATPTLNVQPRSALSATSYALGGGPLDVQCTALHEMQALAVRIRWQYTASDGSTSLVTERAGDDALPIGPNVLILDSEVADNDALSEVMHYHIADRLYAALHPLAYEGRLSLTDNLSPLAAALPGTALNLTGGRTEWTTMAAVVQQVQLAVVDEAESITVGWGAPRHLGLSDWLALRDLGNAGADNARWDNSRPTTGDPQPGTIDDLNGATGGSAPVGDVIDQARGGMWAKVGFAEYPPSGGDGSIVDPAIRYRIATGSESIFVDGGLLACSYTWATTGQSRYSAETGALVEVMHYTIDGIDQGERLSGEFQGAVPSCGSGYFTYHTEATRTTFREWMTVGDGSLNGSTSGSHTVTLSDPDDAIAAAGRAFSAHPWAIAESCIAIRTPEASTLTGKRVEIRWGSYVLVEGGPIYTPITGMQPGTCYCVRRTARQRPVATDGTAAGDWVTLPDRVAPFLTGATGAGGVEWQYEAAPTGWEIELGSPRIEPY